MNSSNFTLQESYCSYFNDVRDFYLPLHGYTSLIVCLFGSVANLLNIMVLTRREMSSPTNAILTGLAVADLLVMLEYIPFAWYTIYKATSPSTKELYTYSLTLCIYLHSNFSQVCHTISIWLTVTLAIWRYIAVAYPQRNHEWCGPQKTILIITSGYIVSPLINIPLFLAFSIQPVTKTLNESGYITDNASVAINTTIYLIDVSELGQKNDNLLIDINFWVYSIVIKIIPCLALTLLSGGLIWALMQAKRRRKQLMQGSKKTPRNIENDRTTDRTTKMLLAVLLLFLITELPQGILGLLSLFFGRRFFERCYVRVGDIMDILALLNSAINFILYCTMSRQFRKTFSLLFRPRWLPVAQTENGINLNHTTTMVTQV
uniref:FMRFamide receptor n=1 Tax=Lygus hesperus TaxID=30085 RepID=A0A0A9WNR0_LYGHE